MLRKKERQQKGDLESLSKTAVLPDEVGIQFEFQDSLEPLKALGLKVTSQEGRFAGGIIAIDLLAALAAHPNIVRIEKPEHDKKRLNKSIPDIRANQVWSRSGDTFSGNTGNEVIIGIVDTGIDYVHKTFRKADNTSRILFLWDQTLDAESDDAVLGEEPPGTITTPAGDVDLDYGVEFVRQDDDDDERPTLNKALAASDPYSVVRHKDMDGHGSHVAGIAAGDGSQSDACCGAYTYIGVAPEADLIIVRKLGLTDGDPSSPHTSNSKIDAIRYILNRANGRPCVINLSLGRDIGARDGSGVTEQRVDNILASFPQGVAICQSSGNEANDNIHAQGDVPANGTAEILFKVYQSSSNQTLRVELWYGGNHLEAAVKPPNETFAEADWNWVGPGDSEDDLGYNGEGEVALENEEKRIRVTLTPPDDGRSVSGKWTFRLRNNTGDDTPVHIWCDAGIIFKGVEEDAALHVTTESTINPEASAKNVIVVGAYAAEGSQSGHLAGFSSRGPALDSNQNDDENRRPHISAPGVSVTSAATAKYRSDELSDAICCCDCCQDFYIDLDGTSMATPHVTGAVALMLQEDPTLSYEQLREKLQETAREADLEELEEELPNNNWGWGKLDVKDAVDASIPPASPRMATPPGGAVAVRQFGSTSDLLALRNEFFSIPKARFYRDLLLGHFQEVRNLINTNKRVATVWHRNSGPAILRTGMQAAFRPEQPLPVEIDGVGLIERLQRIADILKKYGSETLNRDIEEHVRDRMWVLGEGFSIRQLLDLFKAQETEMAGASPGNYS